MDQTVQKKLEELEQKKAEAKLVEALLVEFPDLKITTDRWKRQRYSSASVNARATSVDFRHNCGCCPDSPLEARPYIEALGVQIFANPDRYCVAEKYNVYEVELPGWEADMRKEGVSDAAIEQVRSYLVACQPPPYQDDDEDEDEND